jgi:hypothetical protein
MRWARRGVLSASHTSLCVQPEVSGVAKDPGENECGIGSDRAAIAAQFIDMLAGQPGALSEVGLRHAEWLKELFNEDFAYWNGFSLGQ